MNIKIDDNIIQKTTKCRKNFSCLSGEINHICKVEECMSEIIFIKCAEQNPCKYRTYFGYSQLCSCPVRRELYFRYKIWIKSMIPPLPNLLIPTLPNGTYWCKFLLAFYRDIYEACNSSTWTRSDCIFIINFALNHDCRGLQFEPKKI